MDEAFEQKNGSFEHKSICFLQHLNPNRRFPSNFVNVERNRIVLSMVNEKLDRLNCKFLVSIKTYLLFKLQLYLNFKFLPTSKIEKDIFGNFELKNKIL